MASSPQHIRQKRKRYQHRNNSNSNHKITRYDQVGRGKRASDSYRDRSRSRSRGRGHSDSGGRSRDYYDNKYYKGRGNGNKYNEKDENDNYKYGSYRTHRNVYNDRKRIDSGHNNRHRPRISNKYDGHRPRVGCSAYNGHTLHKSIEYDSNYDDIEYDTNVHRPRVGGNGYGRRLPEIHDDKNERNKRDEYGTHNCNRGVIGNNNQFSNEGCMGDNNHGILGNNSTWNNNTWNNPKYFSAFDAFLMRFHQRCKDEQIMVQQRLMYKRACKLITSGVDLYYYSVEVSIEDVLPIVFNSGVGYQSKMEIINSISSEFGLKMKQLNRLVFDLYCNNNSNNNNNNNCILSNKLWSVSEYGVMDIRDVLLLLVINTPITDEKFAILNKLKNYSIVDCEHVKRSDFEELNNQYKNDIGKLRESFKLLDDGLIKISKLLNYNIKLNLKYQYEKCMEKINKECIQIIEDKIKVCYNEWTDLYNCNVCNVQIIKLHGKNVLQQQIKVMELHEETPLHKERMKYKKWAADGKETVDVNF